LDTGATMIINYTSTTASAYFTCYQWTLAGGAEPVLEKILAVVSNTNITVSTGTAGYFAWSITMPFSSSVTVNSMKYSCSGSIFAHQSLPNYDVNVGSCNTVRILSASVQYTNTTQELQQNGDVAMYQFSAGEHWTELVPTTGGYNLFSTPQGSYFGKAAKGSFGFLKPGQPTDFLLRTNVQVENGLLIDSYYPLDHESSYLGMYITQSTTAAIPTGVLQYQWGLEYESEDVWRDVQISQVNCEDYRRAFTLLKEVPAFHENPLHLAQIWNAIKSGAKTVIDGAIKYGPIVAKVASYLKNIPIPV